MKQINEPRGVAAVAAAFATARAERRAALITFLTAGYPSLAESASLARALQDGGADLIELGVPFSDPMADGPTIQRASYAALEAGVTPRDCLNLAATLRREGVTIPLLLMGYYNPILSYGPEAFAQDTSAAGVDGLIVPDLPPEEADPLQSACERAGLALVFLIAPTTSDERLAAIAQATTGFLYVVSRLGTTGAALQAGPDVGALLDRARRYAATPIAVGFGVSTPDQARALAPLADGVIVGSAIVERAPLGAETLRAYVASLRAAALG